jgi:DNA polymerase
MKDNLKEKVNGFLQWYQDLYGKDWYVDSDILPSRESGEASQQPLNRPEKAALSTPLQKFHGEIADCRKCPLGKTRTRFVFGTGNEDADIMFIGEAPGYDEDQQGIPFVGRAGQLLNKLLEQVNLKRPDVYIANILKCRPPNNRDPLPEEVEKCIPYLHRQIEMIKPEVLVALGRVAAQNLLGTQSSLSSMRNQIWSYREIPLFVTYHPAYILRNNSMLNSAIDDMRRIVEYYQKVSSNR